MQTKSVVVPIVIFLIFWLYLFQYTLHKSYDTDFDSNELNVLEEQARLLQKLLTKEKQELERMKLMLSSFKSANKNDAVRKVEHVDRTWHQPIPVLVFACNRPNAVKNHLEKLLKLRQSKERFPIIVSQDCDDDGVRKVVEQYGSDVEYIKHVSGQKAKIEIPSNHRMYTTYYYIARHYKLALEYIFEKRGFSSVIITEDDLDVAPDFLEFFSSTRYLLDKDPQLWCVSAWNDNGKISNINSKAAAKLYRSDFFSGLGWMMARKTWDELGSIWPSGFWDDWMRDPLRRKNRQCIRPEVSRTGMTVDGKDGASKGQFFGKHLAKIVVNRNYVNFTNLDLDYLLQANYDSAFENEVFVKSQLMGIDETIRFLKNPTNRKIAIRVEYNGNIDYIHKADKLKIMHDFKAGVPRTAYKGVVTCFKNGIWVYLAPDRKVITGYNTSWEVPSNIAE
ncbi:unnamed protein product [Auanema sp. JU1783]|nr:unnamed protein product [Auanema sp. JU1783]